jgi:Putative beta-barrel porin-2, OmpL-like. bbp2
MRSLCPTKKLVGSKEFCSEQMTLSGSRERREAIHPVSKLPRNSVSAAFLSSMFIATLTLVLISSSYAQTEAESQGDRLRQPSKDLVALNGRTASASSEVEANIGANTNSGSNESKTITDPEIPLAVQKELQIMKARIEQLEMELKHSTTAGQLSAAPKAVESASEAAPDTTAGESAAASLQEARTGLPHPPEKPKPSEPFAYADWTWLNGTPRNKDVVWDSKFFTPEVRFDTHFVHSFNHPQDDSMGGSTEIFRSNEIQVEQISVGGDFHWQNVRGRLLTLMGMFGVTTPRNDASAGRGQWGLRGAYRYVAEAYGGYHFNVNHGLNFDTGIFVSYIGLFSYYNFDNWAYQPSYVSSNTPWFFNGIRIQWFPTDRLKIEPWIINGWQSYGRLGSKPGLGGQILWRPKPWLSMVSNNYGMGEDTLGIGNGQFGRSRIHTDDSIEVKYYDRPQKFLDKMALSLTGDLGCEYGGPVALGQNVNCHHNTATSKKQTFAGWMLYNRSWFKKDLYAITVGGGKMDNPGRYLTLLPPINGADAVSGSPYFTGNPGDPFKAWDASITFDWMPKQYITFRTEYGYRHANVAYWSGRGGITPPGGNTGSPSVFAGGNSGSPGQVVPGTTFVPGPFLSATPGLTCVAGATGWCPDLRKDEPSMRFAVMVKF